MPIEINTEIAQKVLDTVDAGLVEGVGDPIPGKMCVEAAVCFALGLPHSDDPPCVSRAVRRLKIGLNDAGWSSNEARAQGLRRLAVAQLGSESIDDVEFARRVVIMATQTILPPVLRRADLGLERYAKSCAAVCTLNDARSSLYAAYDAAHDTEAHVAARCVAYEMCEAVAHATNARVLGCSTKRDAVCAAREVSYAAIYAARGVGDTVGGDACLAGFAERVVQILIDMGAPGVQWLNLTV